MVKEFRISHRYYLYNAMVSAEQQQVLAFLRSSPNTFFSAPEISKRAGNRKQYEKDPRWAVNCLRYLMDMKLVERDGAGHYKLAGSGPKPAEPSSQPH